MEQPLNRPMHATIASLLLAVAAIAVLLALMLRIRQAYAAIPPRAAAAYPEPFATAAVTAWIGLSALTTTAWRGGPPAGFFARVLVTSLLCLTRLAFPSSGGYGTEYHMLWPVYCFGLGITAPLLIRRFRPAGAAWERADGLLLVLVDSAIGALLVLVFADFVPRM